MADILTSTFGDILLQHLTKSNSVTTEVTSNIREPSDLRAVFLMHLMQLRCNSYSVSSVALENASGTHVQKTSAVCLGSAIYPTASLINHSCYPNAILRLVLPCMMLFMVC